MFDDRRVMRHQLPRLFFAGVLSFFLFFASPFSALALAPFTVYPAVIDAKGKDREILRYTITLSNTSSHLLTIYPWVTDMDASSGVIGKSDLDGSREKLRATSMAQWVEVTRGVIDLLPGEKKDIPVTIQVHMDAMPGVYHGVIRFSAGPDRASAERDEAQTASVLLNMEVLDDATEKMQLVSFSPERNIFASGIAQFQFHVENIGNRGLVPHGKIRIFDQRGAEIAAVDANVDARRLEPSAKELLGAVWASGEHFGHYKAMLDLDYGARGTLQDTTFFWVIPWKKLFAMFGGLSAFCVIIAIILHSYSSSRRRWSVVPEEVIEEDAVQRGNKGTPKEKNRSRVDELREVDIPAPRRTRYMIDECIATPKKHHAIAPLSKESRARTTHQVRLVKRERVIPPEHIVNLKHK